MSLSKFLVKSMIIFLLSISNIKHINDIIILILKTNWKVKFSYCLLMIDIFVDFQFCLCWCSWVVLLFDSCGNIRVRLWCNSHSCSWVLCRINLYPCKMGLCIQHCSIEVSSQSENYFIWRQSLYSCHCFCCIGWWSFKFWVVCL